MNKLILKNGLIITPFEELSERIIFLKDKKIEKIIHKEEFALYTKDYIKGYMEIDIKNNYISPGFIDIHTHGANNVDVVEDNLGPMCELLARHGTTGFLPTVWTAGFNKMLEACKRINNFSKDCCNGSNVLGINIEGPYLNPNLGAQKKVLVKKPEYKDYKKLVEACGGNLKVMTLAPELEGSRGLIKYLRQNNVIVSIGHSNLEISKLRDVLNMGITLVTHILNAMGESISDEPGTKALGIQEELLICDDLMCEVICDYNGILVKPTWLKILIRCKGIENIILITDSMKMAGMVSGKYKIQDGRNVLIKNGSDLVRLEENGIASTTLTMDKAIKNMIKHTCTTIKDAVRMASYNPASAIGISNRKGIIKEEMDADITVFDRDLNVKLTIIGGEIAYSSL